MVPFHLPAAAVSPQPRAQAPPGPTPGFPWQVPWEIRRHRHPELENVVSEMEQLENQAENHRKMVSEW